MAVRVPESHRRRRSSGVWSRIFVQLSSQATELIEITNDFVFLANRWGMGLGAEARDST
jgi:hypothetical protein